MSTKKKATINKKAAYFQQYKVPKKLVVWVPPHVEQYYFENPDEESIMNLVYFIEAHDVERVDTSLYNNDFKEFYYFHLQQYDNDESQSKFCSNIAGGVSEGYVIGTANCRYGKDNITILSIDVDEESANIKVYALISFRLVSSDTIMVETLCGNQTINSEGEGTRLLNFLKKMTYSIGIPKIALHPIDTAVSYYTRENFRKLKSDEAEIINNASSDEDSPPETMAINQRARRNWNKFKTVTRVLGKFTRNKRLKDLAKKTKEIKRFYKAKYDEKTGKRGIPIPPPFSTATTKHSVKPPHIGKIVGVETTREGTTRTIEAFPIIPGASLNLAREKAAIKDAALMTKIREANLKAEQKAASKSKKNNASGTRKRRK